MSDWIIHRFNIIMDSERANPVFNVEQLADKLAVNHRMLTHKLVSLTGMNASHLMRNYRLQKAAGFLRAGSTISEAAEKRVSKGRLISPNRLKPSSAPVLMSIE